MIRSGYPVPPLTQIRLRLELATRRTRRALEERRRALRAEADARREARGGYLRLRWREDLVRERRCFDDFFDKYDALVGLLCLAAQEGITPEREAEYGVRRAWFCAQYPQVKPILSKHIEKDSRDALPGPWGRRACDAFEALFFPSTLEAMLAADGGDLIGRLMRTQGALEAWQQSIARKEAVCRR